MRWQSVAVCVLSVIGVAALRFLLIPLNSQVGFFPFFLLAVAWTKWTNYKLGVLAAVAGSIPGGYMHALAAPPGVPVSVAPAVIRYFISVGVVIYLFAKYQHQLAISQRNQVLKDAIVSTSLDAIVTIDGKGRIIEFNPAAIDMFGYDRSQVLGRSMSDLIVPERLRTQHRQAFQRHLLTGESRILGKRIELPARRADGSEFPVEIAIKRIDVDEGPIFTADIRDISQRKAHEEALETSEARYRAFVQNSTEAIWRFEIEPPIDTSLPQDRQIKLMFEHAYLAECNDTMARIYGYEHASDLIGARLAYVLVPDDPKHHEYLRRFIESQYRLSGYESHEVNRDRADRFFLSNLVGEVTDGLLVRAWGSQTDITERKRAEAREQAARQEAEQANQLKDEFLATLSHELRTPLNAIIGFARILHNPAFATPDRLSKALDVIDRNSIAMSKLITDLLDVSRIITGKPMFIPEEVDPVNVINEAVESVRAGLEAKSISLRLDFDHRSNLVWADPARLKQVVWNLLSNALKFSRSGGSITVSTKRMDSRVQIVVTDTGCGIRPDFLPFIFDRFRQADATLIREAGGLGLGLSIVKNLVELQGGRVTAYSEGVGKGARFSVELPLLEVRRVSGDRRAYHPIPELGNQVISPIRLDGLRILAVEDHEGSAELVHMLLTDRGADVDLARSAKEAWLLLTGSNSYHVLISDIQMPGEDGYMLIQKLRQSNLPCRNLPAIALTAHARSEDRAMALHMGFRYHVAKPVDENELVAVIEQLCLPQD